MDSLQQKLVDRLAELKADGRMAYKSAHVLSNAPLALIQHGMLSQINLIEEMLGLPKSQLPITNDQSK